MIRVRSAVVLMTVVVLLALPASAARLLGARKAGGDSRLYEIAPATAFVTLIGSIGFAGVSGMTLLNDGRLVASASGLVNGIDSALFIEIDPDTGAGTLIGVIGSVSAGTCNRMPDLAYDAANDVLYGYGDACAIGKEGLYTVNPITGAGTFVGASGFSGGGNGLDVHPTTGVLYATPFDLQSLVTISPLTGAGTDVPGSAGNVPFRINALEFNPTGTLLYGSWNASGISRLVTIDTSNGVGTPIGTMHDLDGNLFGFDALAFLPEGACCTNGPGTETECEELPASTCDSSGGLFLGEGSVCAEVIDCFALVVTYEAISARETEGGVLVSWTTATEVDTVGFRVLRESSRRGEKTLTAVSPVIHAGGTGLNGMSYEFLDNSKAAQTAVHYYLEDIDFWGRVTQHGPVAVRRIPGGAARVKAPRSPADPK